MHDEHNQQEGRIGNLNGPWAMLLKFMLASYAPATAVLIAWSTWVTSNIFDYKSWKAQGPRFMESDAKVMKLELTAERNSAIQGVKGELTESMAGVRKSNLDLQGQLQRMEFDLQRLNERLTGAKR